MNLKELSKPFPASDIEWRVGRAGETNGKIWAMVLAYINARAVMDRLDDVVGPGNWRDRYWSEGKAIMCGLSIKVGDEWIEKVDGAEETDIEAVKGGLSGALKRAAVKWGIGRYLYNLEEGFAQIVDKGTKGSHFAQTKEKKPYYWLPPELPKWALPEGSNNVSPLKAAEPQVVNPGEFKLTFGKYLGKTFGDMGLSGVKAWKSSLERKLREEKKTAQGPLAEAFTAADLFIAQSERNSLPLASGEDEIPF